MPSKPLVIGPLVNWTTNIPAFRDRRHLAATMRTRLRVANVTENDGGFDIIQLVHVLVPTTEFVEESALGLVNVAHSRN